MTQPPERRLREAVKQLELAARDDRVNARQTEAAEGLAQTAEVLADSVEITRESETIVADGQGCFFCTETDYHPDCDRPGCENDTHGFGPRGMRTNAYCDDCQDPNVATDGGPRVDNDDGSSRTAPDGTDMEDNDG